MLERKITAIVLFIVKQNTEYWFIVRDWRSDVCSSDLVVQEEQEGDGVVVREGNEQVG